MFIVNQLLNFNTPKIILLMTDTEKTPKTMFKLDFN